MFASAVSAALRVHRAWAWAVIVSNGVIGLWGVAAQRFTALRGRPFWIGLVTAEAAIALQVSLGAFLFSQGMRPPNLHIFYGVLLVVFPTLVWVYRTEPAFRRRTYLFYGLASLFFMGLAIRALLQVS